MTVLIDNVAWRTTTKKYKITLTIKVLTQKRFKFIGFLCETFSGSRFTCVTVFTTFLLKISDFCFIIICQFLYFLLIILDDFRDWSFSFWRFWEKWFFSWWLLYVLDWLFHLEIFHPLKLKMFTNSFIVEHFSPHN